MLLELRIKDFAIIDDLNIPFGQGLNVLTGETGAGKSVIAAAIGLLLGERGEASLIRGGADQASLSAVFDAAKLSDGIKSRLKSVGIEVGDELVVGRIISSSGKGRAYINEAPVTQQFLKEIGMYLVDVSSQHAQQLLIDPKNHLSIIDQFAGLVSLRDNYLFIYNDYIRKKEELRRLKESEGAAKEKASFLEFQINEIRSANVTLGEDLLLEQERKIARHGSMLLENLNRSESLLYSDGNSVLDQVRSVSSMLKRCAEADESFNELVKELESANIHMEDVARRISKYKDKINVDPNRLEFIEERLYLLSQLKKKHGGALTSVLKRCEELSKELYTIEHYDESLKETEEELKKIRKKLIDAASRLSEERKKAALKLDKEVQKELNDLDFKRTTFHVKLGPLEGDEFGPDGRDAAEFLFAPNLGEPMRPLARIASGGELSRVTLAIKQILGGRAELASTFVFDEVDSGIGGRTAEIVGRKLKSVSSMRQVICITHLPQVASYADSHYRITKTVRSGRTVTRFDALEKDERVEEIARMLGGVKVGDSAKAHARDMLKNANFPRRGA